MSEGQNNNSYQEEEQIQRGYKNCEAFCNSNINFFIFRQLVELVKDYKQNKQSISHYYGEIKKLFSDQPTVIDNVNRLFYHDARIKSNDTIQQLECLFKQDKQRINLLEQTKNLILKGNLDQQQQLDLISIQFKDDPEALKEIQNVFKLKKQKQKIQVDWNDIKNKRVKPNPPTMEEIQSYQAYYTQHFYNNAYQLQASREIKNEIIVLDKLRLKCFSHFTSESDFNQFFDEFVKVINLYTECIITQYELMDILSSHMWIDQEIIDELRIAIFTRAPARRQQTQLFKPLKDTDFKNAEHITGSYVRMHPGYANIMKEDPKLPNVLNHLWVSVPFGSEDYSFSIMRKNSFEEQLFKIEDEMFEYDVNINCYRRTIKLLDQLIAGNNSQAIEQQIRKILQIKCLQSVYKTNSKDQEEVITLWQKNPILCSPILRDRLNQKCQELIKSREIANQTWKITQKNNFSRSLDHRSFYFKKNEKQYTCVSRFLKEPDEKYSLIQTNNAIQAEYLNSLVQLTTIKPLSHGQYVNINDIDQSTVFSFYISSKTLLEETFEIFKYYVEQSNQNESEWILDLFQKIYQGYFNLDLVDQNYNFSLLRAELSVIEQYVTSSSFSYIDQFNIEQEQIKKSHINTNNSISNNGKDSDDFEESDYELQRIKILKSPLIDEQDVFPRNSLQLSTNFQSKYKPHGKIIYGTSGIYLFFRYFYSLYQRIELAQQISQNFEQNEKFEKLDEKEKKKIIELRYKLFKHALLYQIKNKDFKYQDYLSLLFGKQAFLFYTIDKMLSDCCKHLASLVNDKLTDSFFDFLFKSNHNKYELDPTKTEEVQLSNLSYALLDLQLEQAQRVLFRFCLQDDSLHVNYLPNWSVIQDKQQLNRISQFVKSYTTTYSNRIKGVFLQRNLRETRANTQNQIEWTVFESMRIRNNLSDILIK
ncbi:unnamed protein product (macronuclear) [Paramecium tetraurelia]|uniref:Histone deacetylase interacting domain-containing protein n=1 Tax=Paramecium tetraurelia TaxID=5888 RepID=A0E7D1_PARTE|nr:uncharacterized protein GSPATT00023926001 [Paramecium tetraurelia]CAK91198.1 unnamed protein product [Paramecium tetraurelia]|eukprot:XP_001458595.1 hypothetical protein (macronuclear) [Paramecium tetraurelia strain d4-2]